MSAFTIPCNKLHFTNYYSSRIILKSWNFYYNEKRNNIECEFNIAL